jgi:hypothetical protein
VGAPAFRQGVRRAAALVAVASLGLLAACSSEPGPRDAAPSTAASDTEAPLIPAPSAMPTELPEDVVPSDGLSTEDAQNLAEQAERIAGEVPAQERPAPVDVGYGGVFADPDITFHQGTWYAVATNTGGANLPVLRSTDLATWSPTGNGLPSMGGWVRRADGGLWAPSIARVGDGWTAAYSAPGGTLSGERHNCIGLARSSSPAGPYRPVGEPLCYGQSLLGVIDPDVFVDDEGTPWLLWKFSGIRGQRPAGIFIRELDADGSGFAAGAETTELLTRSLAWEGRTIENPSMVQFRGVTYLFYSGNSWKTSSYATGYAICARPTGPCVRPGDGSPLLTTASTGKLGPGGASAFRDGKSLRLLYHAWAPGRIGVHRGPHVAGLWQRRDGTLELVHPG